MPIILLDGVEKAGKTTLAQHLEREYGASYRHHGKGGPDDDTVYASQLLEDTRAGGLVVWDRAWPSMAVYDTWERLPRRLVGDPFLGEWLYGRALRRVGVAQILLGPGAGRREALRTPDDCAIPFALEEKLYQDYDARWWYSSAVHNAHGDLDGLAHELSLDADTVWEAAGARTLPAFCGPPDAQVTVIGPRPDPQALRTPGGILPFTDLAGTRLGRALGRAGLDCAWTTVDTDPEEECHDKDLIIACGPEATDWAYAQPCVRFERTTVLSIPEPQVLYAGLLPDSEVRRVETVLKHALAEVDTYGR